MVEINKKAGEPVRAECSHSQDCEVTSKPKQAIKAQHFRASAFSPTAEQSQNHPYHYSLNISSHGKLQKLLFTVQIRLWTDIYTLHNSQSLGRVNIETKKSKSFMGHDIQTREILPNGTIHCIVYNINCKLVTLEPSPISIQSYHRRFLIFVTGVYVTRLHIKP